MKVKFYIPDTALQGIRRGDSICQRKALSATSGFQNPEQLTSGSCTKSGIMREVNGL